MTRKLILSLLLICTLALVCGSTNALAAKAVHAPTCASEHPGAGNYCIAVGHRKAIRLIRHKQVQEVVRTHVHFKRAYYRGWDVPRLAAARRWEWSRLLWLRKKPTWWPKGAVPLGKVLAQRAGWVGAQWSCLYKLWNRESGWTTPDYNSSSGAGGIPQALPPSKMGPGWQNNLKQQILWGIGYVRSRYGSACNAWAHSNAYNWY